MTEESIKNSPDKEPSIFTRELRRANGRRLLELVRDHLRAFTLREVRQTLLNPHVTAEVIDEILLARHLQAVYAFKAAVARHPRTRETSALRIIPNLFWRDLMEIGLDPRIHPAVRRSAEKYLVQRLARLTVGEKINLARRAGPDVLAHLLDDPHIPVLRALLENPRLTEAALLPLANRHSASPRNLRVLARDPRWGRCYEIRAALARNPATPYQELFEILPDLHREDLEAVAAIDAHSWIVRHRAEELYEEAVPRIETPEEGEPWIIL